MSLITGPGYSLPIGATVQTGGVNFCLYSRAGTAVELLLFDDANDDQPRHTIPLDPFLNRTFHYWHVFVPGIGAGQVYAYRVYGPYAPEIGRRFDPEKVLLDPYGRALTIPRHFSREAAKRPGDNTAVALKSVVANPDSYDWEGDEPLRRPFNQTIIYEMHVGGFTRHPNSGIAPDKRGTYAGLVEKIPYLKSLGITAVELLPVFQFDKDDAPDGRTNYWGYSPISFFAPHADYSSNKEPLGVLDEFRDMVKALHRADIEVILDVVYNHTAEGDHTGPTYCFKGIGNHVYYILTKDKSRYANYSGTGNTLNANHSTVRRLILDSLHYWVEEMHVDGFRFDLASILSRDGDGHPLANPPILWDIETDPCLAGTKLIAEAWDAGGLYQVGSFLGDKWKEWNGRFRDDLRAFLKGDPGMTGKVASRFLASPDLYGHEGQEPEQSINFVTCHDGFTLNDLVSYNDKHNEANGENNNDGHNHNLSWNCGVEGPTDDPEIEALRIRQIKNFFTLTLLSLGVPMLLMGDEVRHTQHGNNNAYCQDNKISWFDWSLLEKNGEIFHFVQQLIALRQSLSIYARPRQISLVDLLHQSRIEYHGIHLHEPDWGHDSHTLAFTVWGSRSVFHMILNAYWQPLDFALPPVNGAGTTLWRRIIDTACSAPHDFCRLAEATAVPGESYLAQPRSAVLLAAARQRIENG
ncbi:MAG TPA: glycogen debranching protein GlgX [Chloroflexota bacterium]|nr:glycogen debranching protein GlgX [Chloroflexota bacterium]